MEWLEGMEKEMKGVAQRIAALSSVENQKTNGVST
jgi:hypothetical protein